MSAMQSPTRRESHLRRRAGRERGWVLRKDRARSWNVDHQGGYMIVDLYSNSLVAGQRFDLGLDDVEWWLAED